MRRDITQQLLVRTCGNHTQSTSAIIPWVEVVLDHTEARHDTKGMPGGGDRSVSTYPLVSLCDDDWRVLRCTVSCKLRLDGADSGGRSKAGRAPVPYK